jgi:hypothetical protein
LECVGPTIIELHCVFGDFYTRWILNVFVVPAILAVVIALNFCWDRRDPQRDAGKRCRTLVFIVGFLIYPRVSKRIFEIFVCRHLSETEAWLEADYSIACTTSTHAGFVGLAGVLVILVPLGIPAFVTVCDTSILVSQIGPVLLIQGARVVMGGCGVAQHDWHHEGHKGCNYTFSSIGGVWDCIFGTRKAGRYEANGSFAATSLDKTPRRGLPAAVHPCMPVLMVAGLAVLKLTR